MADRVVSLLVERLEAWIDQEIELLRGVSDEIRDIKDEFENIGAFLREADAMVDNNAQMKVWVKQVNDVANEIEHLLEEHILAHHKNNGDQDVPGRHGFDRFIKGIFQRIAAPFKCFKGLQTEHDIATRIKDIKARVIEISERRHRYEMNISLVPTPANNLRDPREDALFLDESQIVGIDGPRKILIGFLSEEDTRLGVISVYGMGGLGKTTLAKKVYEAYIVKREFSLRAWVTMSQVFNAKSLLTDLYIQLFGMVEGLDKMEPLKLKQEVNSKLQGCRYLVVLDDIWTMDAWKAFRNALPNDNNSCSRIIITTRFENIAAAACGEVYGHLYPLKALNPEDSWKLFSKKVVISSSNEPHVPTQELKERAAKFLDKCNGLPLGLVAIGGLLSTKPLGKWEETHERFQHYMDESGSLHSEEVDDVRLVISFSCNELPYRLKSCFLYLGIFPEDHSINCSKLFRMWSAEGCVVREHQANMSIEELAKPYLDELIQRSLVQVEVVDVRRRVVTCKVHDLIRDFIIGKAGNQNCTTIFCPKEEASSRLQYNEDHASHLRVLFIEYSQRGDFKAMNLSYLRYLSVGLGNPSIDLFSIGKFKYLETLDFRGQFLHQLGDEILQLTQLRNLLTGKHHNCPATGLPTGMHRLKKLERLSLVSLQRKKYGKGISSNELGMLTQLRKLSVCDFTEDDETQLFGSVEKMRFLKTFKVKKSLKGRGKFLHSQRSFSFPPSLQCLFMIGKLDQLPPWISSLQNLERLFLSDLHMSNKFIESLEALPNLMVLELGGRFEELRFSSTGFPRLRELDLFRFDFDEMTVEEGAMPDIRSVSFAGNTTGLIEGLAYLTTLEEIIIHNGGEYGRNDLGPRLEKYSWQQGHNPQIVVNHSYRLLWPLRHHYD